MSSGSTHRVFKMFNRRLVDMLRCSSLSYANCRALRRRQRRAPESPNPKHRTPENHQSPKNLQYRKHQGKMRTDWNLEFEVSLEFGAWGLVLPAKASRSLGIGFWCFRRRRLSHQAKLFASGLYNDPYQFRGIDRLSQMPIKPGFQCSVAILETTVGG